MTPLTGPRRTESMRTVPVFGVGSVPGHLVERAAASFAARHTLAEVLAWAREQEPVRQVSEIVTQDEYTHDVVLPFDGSHFVVFDAT
ncbi:MAG: hypothetical protein ACJ77Q_02075 [Gemmatimonadaceae bacterium]